MKTYLGIGETIGSKYKIFTNRKKKNDIILERKLLIEIRDSKWLK